MQPIKNSEDEVIRLLIVDDDKDDRAVFAETINAMDTPHITYSASGCEALFTVLEEIPQPHVIFMDINMPLPNGVECVKRLKADARYAKIPVIMYSVSSAPQDIETAYAAGAHYYVVKPYATSNLSATLKKALKPDWRKPQPIPAQNDFVIDISFEE